MDAVKRNDVVEAIENIYKQSNVQTVSEFRGKLIVALSYISSVDNADREHGNWILDFKNNTMTCPFCKHRFKGGFDLDGADNFCRHCGADMRGERDDS